MIDFAVRLTIMLALVACADTLFLRTRASAAFRHMVWTGSIFVILLLPVFQTLLPEWRVPVHAREAITPVFDNLPESMEALPIVSGPSVERVPAPAVQPRPAVSWPLVLAFFYAVVALVLMVKIVVELLTVRSLSRGAKELDDPVWREALASAAASLNVRRHVRLLYSDRNVMPLTFGLMRPVVLLPAAAVHWSEHRRRSVLLHELAHVARNDCGTQVVAAIACALYWVHPLVWYAAYRMRVEREYACDDATLMGGVAPHAYANDLLEIAHAHFAPTRLRTAAVSMATSVVESRLLAVIDARRARNAPRARVKGLLAALALISLVPLSTLRAVERTGPERPVGKTSLSAPTTDTPPAPRPAAETADSAAPVPDQRGEWALRLADSGEGGLDEAAAHVMLNAPGLNTFYVPVKFLRGLDAKTIEQGGKAVFSLEREAGTLHFTGAFAGGRGKGTFAFSKNAGFGADLVRRGMRQPTDAELFTLARHGLGIDLLDALAAAGYATPSTEGFVRASLTGVDAAYVRGRTARGVKLGTLQALISYYNNSEDGDEDVAASVAPQLPQRATPLSGSWTLARFQGGITQLELFWTDRTNWRRNIDANQLQGSPAAGSFKWEHEAGTFEFNGAMAGPRGAGSFVFSPNREFVNTLRSLGLVMDEDVSDHTLKNLAWGGITVQDIREFRALGFPRLTLREVVDLAIFEVRPGFLRAERDRGVTFASVGDLIDAFRARN
jgi:beta-lactamase regulating signal transducer with metallopeptidase domain